MRNELTFWVAGGDMRQAKLAELLAADGHTVYAYALERLGPLEGVAAADSMAGAERADCVVLPLPAAESDGRLNAPLSEAAPSSVPPPQPTSPRSMTRASAQDSHLFIIFIYDFLLFRGTFPRICEYHTMEKRTNIKILLFLFW